jgi:hypothetical protein
MNKDTKICPKCGQEKNSTEFHRNKSQPDGLNTYCKVCWLDYCKLRWKNEEDRKARLKVRRNGNLKRKYGITHEDYEEMLQEQDFKCAVCLCTVEEASLFYANKGELGPMLSIDHNHMTGKVRGLLCGGCNISLAQIEKVGSTEPFKEYLNRNENNCLIY